MSSRTLFLTVIFLSLLSLTSCDCGKNQNPKETTGVSGNASYDPDSYTRSSTERSYVQPLNSYGNSYYWYVFFKTDKMGGYLIVKFDEPSFSLIGAISQIKTKWVSIGDEEYIGIEFFAPVSETCYEEYLAEKDE